MKKFIIAAAVAVSGLFITAPEAEAGPRFSISIGGGGGHCSTGYSSHRSSHRGSHCRPYVVRTFEVDRRCSREIVGYARCGRPIYRHVTHVTYKQLYSDGSCNTYCRKYYS